MSQAPFVGINWGSSHFRAYLIGADGTLLDNVQAAAGIIGSNREQMAAQVAALAARWPQMARCYASGMIGSNVGWEDAGYLDCPAAPASLAAALHPARIGGVEVAIVPGLACFRPQDQAPDVMRGEELELFGLLAGGHLPADGLVALPGTHAKWVRMRGGQVEVFMTAMSGEIFDRLTAQGLLASVVDGPARAGAAFAAGVAAAAATGLGLGTSLFGARARVIRGELARGDGASYLRGLLIGAELADVRRLFGDALAAPVPLVGSAPVRALYQEAMAQQGLAAYPVDAADAAVAGFLALHRQLQPGREVAP